MSVVIKAEKLYPLITLRYKQNKYDYEAPINLHHEKIPTDATSKLWEKKKRKENLSRIPTSTSYAARPKWQSGFLW